MHILMHNSVLQKKDNVVLDRNITSAQIPIECTKCVGNSVQQVPMLSFLLVNMQYVDVLWLRDFCVLLDGIYNMANDVVLTLIKHTVLFSLYDCFVTTALHLGNILVASQMFGRYYGYLVGCGCCSEGNTCGRCCCCGHSGWRSTVHHGNWWEKCCMLL